MIRLLLIYACLTAGLCAAEIPHSWKDDAALHSVQALKSPTGFQVWAVGDRGTIWHSSDEGQTWRLQNAPTNAALHSVCFLTPQIGWAVGSGTQPFSGQGYGVILKTIDGGITWTDSQAKQDLKQPKTFGKKKTTAIILDQPQSVDHLPPLRYVRFFNPDEGVAVGEASAAFPTGVLATFDGGESWEPAKGDPSTGWLAANFREIEHGVLVGDRGRISVAAELEVVRSRQERTSLRGVRGITFADGLNAWAVGDGGLILKSQNGGVSWEAPQSALPASVGVFCDFQTVFARGSRVWIAGSPGGRVWHSADGGQSWIAQPTGLTTPLFAMHFVNDQLGFGVGAFGSIVRTDDGGESWQPVRVTTRRAALMTLHARPERLPFNALSKYAGENGYRAVSLVVPRWETLSDRDSAGPIERRINDALISVGGHSAEVGWRLPLNVPEVDRSLDQLTKEWQQHTEGRLVEMVLSDLVAQLRQWRPTVVLLDRPSNDDALSKMVYSAAQRALTAAADPTRFPEHEQFAGLGAWRVERVCVQVPARDAARVIVDPFESLARLNKTVHQSATSARSMLFPTVERSPQREGFEIESASEKSAIQTVGATRDDVQSEATSVRELFAGLSIPADSEARRALIPLQENEFDKQREAATRQRNFRGIVDRYLDQPERAAGLLGELRNALNGLPRSQVVLQLVQLADDHRRRGQWDLAEATQIEIINRFPDEPAAAEAMLWLMRFWSSEEMSWQRSRHVDLQAGRITTDRAALISKLTQLVDASSQQYVEDPLQIARETKFDPQRDMALTQKTPSQDAARWRDDTQRVWSQQAVALARLIRQRNRGLFNAAEVQYPLGAALRQAGMSTALSQLVQQDSTSPLAQLVSKDTLLAQASAEHPPTQFAVCQRASARPQLDGVLSDPCWQSAKEIRLAADRRTPTEFKGSYAFVLMTYDDQHLYLAASLPRAEGVPMAGPQYAGRKHDADLTGFDRVTFSFDVNRDFATAYHIHIDQRGHVAEQCWEDAQWNPSLFVAVQGDETHWRLEVAIPFAELTPKSPNSSTIWALGIRRTMPLSGFESWPTDGTTVSSSSTTSAQSGTLKFR